MGKELFIKGFDKDLKCRGYQFEIGKTYDTRYNDNELSLCTETVFHFCRNLKQVHKFYNCRDEKNRYCYVEVLGKLVEDDNKCGSNKIKIVRELTVEELKKEKMMTNGNTGIFNSGYRNTGDYNTGDYNSGYRNTGDYNSGYRNTGDYNSGYHNTGDYNIGNRNNGNYNTGDYNTGDYNSGYHNTGNYNTGDYNSGYHNTGDYNSGYRNTGIYNTGNYNTGNRNNGNYNTGNYNSGYYNNGNYNTGDYNSGDYNTGNYNSGFFNTRNGKIYIFNKPADITYDEFRINYDYLFYDLIKTKWVEYTKEEKENSIIRQCIGGYLKKYTDKEMWENWYKNLSEEHKKVLFSIPNFDINIFEEITSIDTTKDYNEIVKGYN